LKPSMFQLFIGYSSCSFSIFLRKNYRLSPRCRWWCHPYCTHLWRICTPSCNWKKWLSWSRLNWIFKTTIELNWTLLHYFSRNWNNQRHQIKAVLCCWKLWRRN
jgi:hypothetical protein